VVNSRSNTASGLERGAFDRTSSQLLDGVRAEDPDAWQRLVSLYSPLVYSWCRSSGLDAEDAADVLQNVFRAIFTGLPRFRHDRPGDTFRGWLRAITGSKINDHFRSKVGEPEARGGTEVQQRFMVVATDESKSSVGSSLFSDLVLRVLNLVRVEFEDRTWQAFWQTTVEDQSTRDVAQALGISEGAIRQAKYKVLRRLRQELGDLEQ
jgi:RNA polymerase sigma-70 factor (ECF subfamily)